MVRTIILFLILLLFSFGVFSIFYFIPKKLGFKKLSKILGITSGIILLCFSILGAFHKQLFPDTSFIVYFNDGYNNQLIGEYKIALKNYKYAQEIQPENADTYYNQALCYTHLKEYESAIENYDKAIELNPKHSLAYNNRGNLNFRLKKYNEALIDFNTSIQLDTLFAESYYNRGLCKLALKDSLGSKNDWEKVNSMNTSYSLIKKKGNLNLFYKTNISNSNSEASNAFKKGLEFAEKSEYSSAKPFFEFANESDPNNAAIINSLALNYYYLNEKSKVNHLFKKAIKADKKFPTSYTNYAFYLNSEGEYQKAIEYLQHGIKYATDNKTKSIFNYTFAISYLGMKNCDDAEAKIDEAIQLETDKTILLNYFSFKIHLKKECN